MYRRIKFRNGTEEVFTSFIGANLEQSDLHDAVLIGADMRWARLFRADLRNADLRYADLRRAFLFGANLDGADMRGARLEGADLRCAKGYPRGARLVADKPELGRKPAQDSVANTREQIYDRLRRRFGFLQEVLSRAGRPEAMTELDGTLWSLAEDISEGREQCEPFGGFESFRPLPRQSDFVDITDMNSVHRKMFRPFDFSPPRPPMAPPALQDPCGWCSVPFRDHDACADHAFVPNIPF